MSQTEMPLKVSTEPFTTNSESMKSCTDTMAHDMVLLSKSKLKMDAINSYINQYGMDCTSTLHNSSTAIWN